MKKTLSFVVVLGSIVAALGFQHGVFTSWGALIDQSSDILIVSTSKCSYSNDMISSDGEILSVLKGDAKLGMIHLQTLRLLYQGERYLVLANHFEDKDMGLCYQAIGDYQVIPINHFLKTNTLAGKPLEKQIAMILKSRLNDLNLEMARANDEKKILDAGLASQKGDLNLSKEIPTNIPGARKLTNSF